MYEILSGLSKEDERGAPRYPVRWPVELDNGKAETRDISITGMYLRSETEFSQNGSIRFSVMLKDKVLDRLECEGQIIRVEQCPDGLHGAAVALRNFRFKSRNQ